MTLINPSAAAILDVERFPTGNLPKATSPLSGLELMALLQNGSNCYLGISDFASYMSTIPAAVIFSAGTQSAALSALTFQNGGGITFGLNNGILTATVAGGGGGGALNVSASNISTNVTQLVFGNANGLSFGLVGNTLTGSYTVPTQTQYVFSNSNNVSFGTNGSTVTASASFPAQTQYVFSNSNNVSFGTNGSTVTAIATFAQSIQTQGLQGIAALGSTLTQGTVVFTNSNNVSWTLNGSTMAASVSFPAQTNQTLGMFATGNTTQSTSGTANATNLVFNGAGNISIGITGGSILISGGTAAAAPLLVSAGTTSSNVTQLVFSNSNGISFGLNGGTITATFAGGGANSINLSAGTTSNLASAFTFANANGVSFGLNAGTLTGSIATSLTNIRVSAGTTSNLLSALTFANANGVSFGINASTLTGSVAAQSVQAGSITITGATTLNSTGTYANALLINASTNITVGFSNGSLVFIGGAGGGGGLSTANLFALGNTTQNSSSALALSALSFNALGAMTWGYSNGSIQVSAPNTSSISGTGIVSISTNGSTVFIGAGPISAFAVSNTTQSSSGALDARSLSFAGAGGVSVGISNGSVLISGATGGGGGGGATWSDWVNGQAFTTIGSRVSQTVAAIVPFYLPNTLAFSNIRFGIWVNYNTAANTSSAVQQMSASVVLYTRNGSTLSSIWSGSYSIETFYQSNSSSVIGSARGVPVVGPATTLNPDHYWAAVHFSYDNNPGLGPNTTALGQSYSHILVVPGNSGALYLPTFDGSIAILSRDGVFQMQGLYSTANTAASIAFTDTKMAYGASANIANLMLNFRNWIVT